MKDFKMQYSEYEKAKEIDKNNIEIGVGMCKVDNLKPSKYFYKASSEAKTYIELESSIKSYYEAMPLSKQDSAEKECDIVSINIAKCLDSEGFSFLPTTLKTIHKNIFKGAFSQLLEKYVGVFRDVNIQKFEDVLGGEKSVEYADYSEIKEILDYDFDREKAKKYTKMNEKEQVLSVAKFISDVWQTHPFREGNTRTIAVFAIKYLKSNGFKPNSDIFKENSKYFRDALVLANYENIKDKIESDFSYLQSFFTKFLIDDSIKLKGLPNR